MQQWEHTSRSDEKHDWSLEVMGRAGWQLCATIPSDARFQYTIYYFKRPIM